MSLLLLSSHISSLLNVRPLHNCILHPLRMGILKDSSVCACSFIPSSPHLVSVSSNWNRQGRTEKGRMLIEIQGELMTSGSQEDSADSTDSIAFNFFTITMWCYYRFPASVDPIYLSCQDALSVQKMHREITSCHFCAGGELMSFTSKSKC